MRTIGVLTSGGDSPGMNAALRAVVRKGLFENLRVMGIFRGFSGLVEGKVEELSAKYVGDIMQRGGSKLECARCEEFKKEEGQLKALDTIRNFEIEGLVIIGGDGSFRGALDLSRQGVSTIGIPGTIDNDIPLTDYSIGFDTVVNTVLDAINKLRDTASSHHRVVILEVMGRKSGWIALSAGLAGGADVILIPEVPLDVNKVCSILKRRNAQGKTHSLIILAEGVGHSFDLAKEVSADTGLETRVTILGHLQRGGTPSAFDRILASRLGAFAVDLLLKGESSKMAGIEANEIKSVALEEVLAKKKKIDLKLYELAEIFSK